ncbi:MAG: M1 family metallopeptidase [Thaumarchaeota archaeon]|nr:M1 family metallopeptidase [Nitrososphaerota archaeon]
MSAAPRHYDLKFEPDFEGFTFRGEAVIHAWCYEPLTTIELDAADLDILSCKVWCDGRPVGASARVHGSEEMLTISMSEPVRGECIISIQYTGTLNDRLLGFYRSRYADGPQTKYLATTQFEAADARRAFPCWDEPNHKATFDITVRAPRHMTAISNMPAKTVTDVDDSTEYAFHTTPVMSTYLVYVGVGEFEHIQNRDGSIRVVTIRGKSGQGRYALELAERLLDMYGEYFGKEYPLPKLDLIALPDFAAGAMENWGAITFRENLLLYDPENSSTQTKQLIAEVVSHELAHQWFGNLVTMEWWNDLWLNESFATFMGTKMVGRLYPEWHMWEQFVDGSMNSAMEMDSLESTHPIDVEVESPSQIREIFDAISYDKGGCMLRMLEDFVGPVNFRNGLRKYLRAFKHRNATGGDLWDSIEWACRKPVREVLEPWLKNPGFPVVDASSTVFTMTLRQERFRADGGDPGDAVWPIPVRFLDGKLERYSLLDTRTASLGLPRRFVANTGRTGFYRVRYHGLLQDEIRDMVADREISGVDRWAVQNDLFAFCLSGRATIPEYLDMVGAYADETEYLPLSNVGRNLTFLIRMSHGEPWGGPVGEAARPLFSGIMERLGWEPRRNDAHTDAFLRSMAITALSRLDDPTARTAEGMLAAFLDGGPLHPDVRAPVFAAAARRGGARMHGRMKSLFRRAGSMEEQVRILAGMCEFGNPGILERTLDYSLTDEVRSQNAHMPVVLVASNPAGRRILWPWLSSHWDDLESKIGHGNPLFGRIISGVAMLADDSYADEIESFLAEHPVPGTERTRRQALELLSIYAGLRRRAPAEMAGA